MRELMRVFKDVGLVEQLGSGMDRILKVYDRNIFRFFDHIIKVNLPIKSSSIKLNKTQNCIISLITEDEQITQKDIAKKLGMTGREVRKVMASLIENEIVKREGSSRNGKWIILNK